MTKATYGRKGLSALQFQRDNKAMLAEQQQAGAAAKTSNLKMQTGSRENNQQEHVDFKTSKPVTNVLQQGHVL